MKVQNKQFPKLYIAAPLFSKAELDFNLLVCHTLSAYFDVFLPQRDGGLLDQMVRNGMPARQASEYVFYTDICAINESDVLLAILDGRVIDEGVSVELGYAFAKNKHCVGLQTCPRRLLPSGNNPMIDHTLSEVFTTLEQLDKWGDFFVKERRCSGSIIPDTNVGGNIVTINEVSDDQKATFFFS